MPPLFFFGALAGILGTICPLQLEIYNISQRHLTLYQFLGIKPNATEEELLMTYQAYAQKLDAEIGTCLDKLVDDDGQRKGDQVPKACISDAYAKAEKKSQLVADTTIFLLDENNKSQYNIYFMPLVYQIHIAEDSIDEKSDLGKWMKAAANVGKLQGSVDDVFKKVCKGFMDE
ncbi:uncharacterized protein NECHADRAFT_88843 [Fusarium vanettenii 77-13-4]|uniref:Uncharacterized protein n=1 Tax=Fusarium vanettenii (strain ATCC MYA-4622 / CBS 123669 / FGSC 9596 / NRRL 45880 / 77-13-4) TaxID=660122 RepID=C7ZN63_FUSV7|nr:uncharacterized protein NECHADRAFT_88843 [Fusarium vanettenii 77-13-4]EEU34544.1 predicted protein [Fusarium vanettenii 77-13-4]